MTRVLLWVLCINLSVVSCYLGITYNLKDCKELPPVQYCGKSARVNPPVVLYFYHAARGQCEPFLWSDCPKSHSNNVFPRKDECEAVCKEPLTVVNIEQEGG